MQMEKLHVFMAKHSSKTALSNNKNFLPTNVATKASAEK